MDLFVYAVIVLYLAYRRECLIKSSIYEKLSRTKKQDDASEARRGFKRRGRWSRQKEEEEEELLHMYNRPSPSFTICVCSVGSEGARGYGGA